MYLSNGGPMSGKAEFFRRPWNPLGWSAFGARWSTLDEFLLSLGQLRF